MVAKKAFTLIELLVVVAIIGILAAAGIYSFSNFTEGGKKRATIANWNQASTYIKNVFGQCQLKGNTGTIVLSPTAGKVQSCTPTQQSTTSLNTVLFGSTQTSNLEKQKYFFCSIATTSTFVVRAKHKEKTCTLSLNQKDELGQSGC